MKRDMEDTLVGKAQHHGLEAPEEAAVQRLDPRRRALLLGELGLRCVAGLLLRFDASLLLRLDVGLLLSFDASLLLRLEASLGLSFDASLGLGLDASFGLSFDASFLLRLEADL